MGSGSSRGLRSCTASPFLLNSKLPPLPPLTTIPQEVPKDGPPAPSERTLFRNPEEILQITFVKIIAEEPGI